jgi:hypothetical protein
LIDAAHEETALPHARLIGEKGRTVGQWRAYADAVGQGRYVEACIDTKNTEKGKNDIRKCNIGIGGILVLGRVIFHLRSLRQVGIRRALSVPDVLSLSRLIRGILVPLNLW